MSKTQTLGKKGTAQHQIATFYIGDLLLGLRIEQVQEINRHLEITQVPHAPKSIRGVINLRGEVVTVLDLPYVLRGASAEVNQSTRNVVIQADGELIGLLVDQMADILSICDDDIIPPPANVRGVDGRYFRGVYSMDSEIVVILDVDEVLS